jgi:hypothetical protein
VNEDISEAEMEREIERTVGKELLDSGMGGLTDEIKQALHMNPGLQSQLDESPEIFLELLDGKFGNVFGYAEHTELELSGPASPKLCVAFEDDALKPVQAIAYRLVLDRLLNSEEGYGVINFGCPDPSCTDCQESERGPHPRVTLHINGDSAPGHNPCIHISICAVCSRDDLDVFIDAGQGRLGSHVDIEQPENGGLYPSRGNTELAFQLDSERSRRSVETAATYYEPDTAGND